MRARQDRRGSASPRHGYERPEQTFSKQTRPVTGSGACLKPPRSRLILLESASVAFLSFASALHLQYWYANLYKPL